MFSLLHKKQNYKKIENSTYKHRTFHVLYPNKLCRQKLFLQVPHLSYSHEILTDVVYDVSLLQTLRKT